jgi:hypothetical protein
MLRSPIAFALVAGLFSTTMARADLVVPGTADPWLAGMSGSATASGGDTLADSAPVLVSGLTLIPGKALTFQVTGAVGYGPASSTVASTPDGMLYSGNFISHIAGAENGISNYRVPIDALVGVFLGNAAPNLSPAPSMLDFSPSGNVPGGTGYHMLSPSLKQVFFIGDGLDGSSALQSIIIPAGATRLYLGTSDGFQWSNNQGQFDVRVNATPEPGTLTLLSLGVVGFAGWGLRRRRVG